MPSCRAPQVTEESAARSHFVAELFHTLAQPVTALRGMLELALRGDADPEAMRRMLREAVATADRVVEALRFARQMGDAANPGCVCPMDLNAALRDAIQEFLPVAEDRGVPVSCHEGEPVWLCVDPSQLSQALFLLLDAVLSAAPWSLALQPEPSGARLCLGNSSLLLLSDAPAKHLRLATQMLRSAGCAVEVTSEEIVLRCPSFECQERTRCIAGNHSG